MNNIFLGNPPENIKQWIIADYNRKQEEKLKTPLCFEAVDDGATIALKCNGNNLKTATFQTSTDGQNWSDYTYGTNITLTIEEDVSNKVYFRAKEDNTTIARDTDNYLQFTTTQPSKKVNVSGNVMSLLAPEFSQLKSVVSYCFSNLFSSCYNISNCGSLTLPATTLADHCYYQMFSECPSIIQAPALPATTLASSCYTAMFSYCPSIIQAPALPATTLASSCYTAMFSNCTSLTQAPALPATTLAESCYNSMFAECHNLTQAPDLPATTLAESCYYSMLAGCSSLTQAPTIKTYTPKLQAFESMLYTFNYFTKEWSLSVCNWPDLTLSEVESMILKEAIFGYSNPGEDVRISITCKDGSGTAYYDSGKYSWVFEY